MGATLSPPGAATLYVSNLSRSATSSSVRRFFGACGDVLQVELITERAATIPSAAYVTMATAAGAAAAVNTLHGRLLHDRSVMVSVTSSEKSERVAAPSKPKSSSVAVAQQYRDARCMTCELEWSGRRLTLQFFFPDDDGIWCVQARASMGGAGFVEAKAQTRELALAAVVKAWQEQHEGDMPWDEVLAALRSVRVI